MLAGVLLLIGIQIAGLMNSRAEPDSGKLAESLRVFSIVSKSKDKNASVWVEDFYLTNDGKEAISVTGGSMFVTGADRNGKPLQKSAGFGLGGTTINGKGPSYTVNPHEIWQFQTVKWEGAPLAESSCGHASFADNSAGKIQLIEVKSITRYLKHK
jgi:hypothetical protein